jgi:hypothetical protein
MQVRIGLGTDGLYDPRMTMPNIGHTDPTDQIDILFSLRVVERSAISTHYLYCQRSRRSLCHMPKKKFTLVHIDIATRASSVTKETKKIDLLKFALLCK